MTWMTALPWSADEVIELIKTGNCTTRTANSCKVMRHRLRNDTLVQERYSKIIEDCAKQGFTLQCGNNSKYTDAELELIKKHIVPKGRSKFACMLKMSELKLSDPHNRQAWIYEDSEDTSPIISAEPPKNLDLTMKAIKSLTLAGMNGHLRVKLTERACGGVAGVGKERRACRLALGINAFEDGAGHIDLAANRKIQGLGEGQGKIENGLDVGGHVLAHNAVATGRALNQYAALVAQGYRKSVDLGLHRIAGLGDGLTDTDQKLVQLLVGEHVGQRVHAGGMGDLIKLIQRLSAHAVGGRRGAIQLGILLLQMNELVVELIVLVVRDLGSIVDVVESRVVLQRAAQLLGAGAEGIHIGLFHHLNDSFHGDQSSTRLSLAYVPMSFFVPTLSKTTSISLSAPIGLTDRISP